MCAHAPIPPPFFPHSHSPTTPAPQNPKTPNKRTKPYRKVVAGLVANFFAERYGYIGPFVFCLFPLSLVAVLAAAWWPENYGDSNLRYAYSFVFFWSCRLWFVSWCC